MDGLVSKSDQKQTEAKPIVFVESASRGMTRTEGTLVEKLFRQCSINLLFMGYAVVPFNDEHRRVYSGIFDQLRTGMGGNPCNVDHHTITRELAAAAAVTRPEFQGVYGRASVDAASAGLSKEQYYFLGGHMEVCGTRDQFESLRRSEFFLGVTVYNIKVPTERHGDDWFSAALQNGGQPKLIAAV